MTRSIDTMKSRLKGSITALVTPMVADRVDHKAMAQFVDWQVREGTHGLVPCGTTGESPTLSPQEQAETVRTVVEAASGRVPVIAGAGSNNTRQAVDLGLAAQKAGADALLVVVPYYNKPDARGMKAHFKAVHDATDLPIVLYNVPGRTVADLTPAIVADCLGELERVIGIKDASGVLDRVTEHRTACGEDFVQLSGDDPSTLGYRAHGGVGCISVTSNVAPRLCADFQNALLENDYATARALQARLLPLHKAMFASPSPGPAKWVLAQKGRMKADTRLPIIGPDDKAIATLRAALVHAGLDR